MELCFQNAVLNLSVEIVEQNFLLQKCLKVEGNTWGIKYTEGSIRVILIIFEKVVVFPIVPNVFNKETNNLILPGNEMSFKRVVTFLDLWYVCESCLKP